MYNDMNVIFFISDRKVEFFFNEDSYIDYVKI